jgi:hypothetical protein
MIGSAKGTELGQIRMPKSSCSVSCLIIAARMIAEYQKACEQLPGKKGWLFL